MYKLFSATTLFVLLTITCQAQDSPYHHDAVQLAARTVMEQASGEIPEHLIYSIEDALIAISQSSFVAANAIFHKYDIHTTASANTNNVRIIVGREAAWLNDLTQTPINQLLPNYELEITQIEETDAYVVLDVSSKIPLNMKFIANEISVVNEIWMVELPSVSNNDNDIKLKVVAEGYIFSFSYKTGNCTTGCDLTHYWEFGVKQNGEVTFIGEHGADLASNDSTDEKDFFTLLEGTRP